MRPYDQLTYNERIWLDVAFNKLSLELKSQGIQIAGDDRAERVIDAIATGIIESRPREGIVATYKHLALKRFAFGKHRVIDTVCILHGPTLTDAEVESFRASPETLEAYWNNYRKPTHPV